MYALTGNQTKSFLVHRMMLQPTEPPSQGPQTFLITTWINTFYFTTQYTHKIYMYTCYCTLILLLFFKGLVGTILYVGCDPQYKKPATVLDYKLYDSKNQQFFFYWLLCTVFSLNLCIFWFNYNLRWLNITRSKKLQICYVIPTKKKTNNKKTLKK